MTDYQKLASDAEDLYAENAPGDPDDLQAKRASKGYSASFGRSMFYPGDAETHFLAGWLAARRSRPAGASGADETAHLAKSIHLDTEGITIEGRRLPFLTGREFALNRFWGGLSLATFGVYTEQFTFDPLPVGCTLTETITHTTPGRIATPGGAGQ